MPLVHLLLLHAATVYSEDTASLHAWNCSQCVLPEMRGFHLFQIIVEPTAQLQAYVGWDPQSHLIIVAFRGTCTSSLRNWIADLEALPRSLSYPGLRHARVHRGFYSAYHFTRLRPSVVHAVLFLMTILPGSFRVAFTGHSLGGALATLSALDLQVSYDLPSSDIRVVTFGSPRVGNAAFATYFRQKVPGSTRVTNWKDLVPHLPPATIGYHHVATEAWIIPESVHNVSFSPSSLALPSLKERSGSVSLPHLLRQRRSLPRRVLHRRSLQRGTSLHWQLSQERTLVLDDISSQARHQGDLTWHVHQCDDTGEDPCCSRSVVGDSIANHLEYLGVPLHSGRSLSDT
ncbi:unnamed protein product [Closterium sp. Yama58-4]|nr:unnamed protein product [Closterium sp. Yama58-4]